MNRCFPAISEPYRGHSSHRGFYIALLCVLGVGLGGCATTRNMRLAQRNLRPPIKILVMQSPNSIAPDRLEKVFAPEAKGQLSVSDEPIAHGVKHAEKYAQTAMEAALNKQPGLVVAPSPAHENNFIDTLQGRDFEAAISQEEADHIRLITGADALLRFNITDYGLTPKTWRTGYITFEVTSTLALAAIIAYSGSTVAKAAAGAYLVQEAAEETAETYAGFWALDKVCRPVRIEAKLIILDPVSTVWTYSDTGLSDIRLSRLTGKIGLAERVGQMDQATDYAAADIVSTLSNSLKSVKSEHIRNR